ncbi:HPr-rel-A system PqqD family peptide chaperone [Sphingomonas sp.]|uniref:HPr-rel-A system PqqD family peptide chaperone n=1 Tax=Sphingomonas sp. TaxID=28214 RepID=UPI003CC5B05C
MPVYRALPADACVTVEQEPFVVLYDRRSGITHLLAEPAPQLLAALASKPLTLAELRDQLAVAYDLPDVTDDALVARLDELVAAGLVETT